MNNHFYTIEPTPELQGIAYNLWQQDGSTNKKIQLDSGINSNWKYRQYIQKNANEIMKYNTMQYINASGNNPYTLLNTETVGNTPYLYNSVHDTNKPLYGFRDSDLKQDYISKEQIKSRMIAPSISTNFF
jgi:hypothetical protein